MPEWKRIIVGEALDLSSRDLNYYRDLFLLWPFLIFSIVAVSNFFAEHSHSERLYSYQIAACAIGILLLAKERALLLLGSLGYVVPRMGIFLIFHPNRQYLLAFLVLAGLAVQLIKSLNARKWKPSYNFPGDMHILDLVVGIAGLVLALFALAGLRPH